MDESANSSQMISKLHSMAKFHVATNPKLSSFYMSQAENLKEYIDMTLSPENMVCHFCGNIFQTGNHNVRVVSRIKLSKSMKKILNKIHAAPILGTFKRKVKDMYAKSKNKMIIHCKLCQHRTIIKCMARREKSELNEESNEVSKSLIEKKKKRFSMFSKKPTKLSHSHSNLDPMLYSVPSKDNLDIAPQCTSTPVLFRKGEKCHYINRTYTKSSNMDTSNFSNCSISSSELSTSGVYSLTTNKSYDSLASHAWDPSICGSTKRQKKNNKKSVHTSLKDMLNAEKQRQESPPNSLYKFLANL